MRSYRDTVRLLLTFVHHHNGRLPAELDWDESRQRQEVETYLVEARREFSVP